MLDGLKDAKVALEVGSRGREGAERELGSHIGPGTKANGNRIPC